jgi:hypothetical protein
MRGTTGLPVENIQGRALHFFQGRHLEKFALVAQTGALSATIQKHRFNLASKELALEETIQKSWEAP